MLQQFQSFIKIRNSQGNHFNFEDSVAREKDNRTRQIKVFKNLVIFINQIIVKKSIAKRRNVPLKHFKMKTYIILSSTYS